MTKPLYNKARETSDLSMTPPYTLEGVVMRVMPLKADIFVLGEFCDSYLNFDNEGQEDLFLPAFPFVLLAIVNYSKIAAPLGNQGWVSQNEVAFSVPLEWYKRKGGEWVFYDWASVSPFIFVDSPGSLTTGREVFGWPKVLANLTAGLDQWVKHPLANETLLSLSTKVIAKTYAGDRSLDRVLLEIGRRASPQILEFPPSSSNPLNLLNGLSKVVAGSLDLGRTVLDSVTRSPLRGFRTAGTQDFFGMLWQTLSSANPMNPELNNNAINLKQFRDAEKPSEAAYQALVCSQLGFKRINGAGLLNESEFLRGDTSGGFEVRIHRYDTQPIVEALGLEYNESHQLESSDVYTLKPMAPFWLDLDIAFGAGQILRWRTKAVDWTTGPQEPERCEKKDVHLFNTTRGAAMEELTGPFWIPNTTIRVLPLLGDRERLQELCDRYFGREFWRVKPFGSYVYLRVTNHETMASESNNLGGWGQRHVDFSIPVLIYDEFESLSQVMLFSPFRYTDSNEAAITGREINGWPSLYADIESPGNSWLGDSGPAYHRQGLVELTTDVLPALGLGQEYKRKVLLEVFSGDVLPYNDDINKRLLATDWAPELLAALEKKQEQRDKNSEVLELLQKVKGRPDATLEERRQQRDSIHELLEKIVQQPDSKELRSKLEKRRAQKADNSGWTQPNLDYLKALSLEILANRSPMREISLKQFRDAEDPRRACLQTIVGTSWRIERIFDIREMDESLTHVAIRHWPSQPIVEQLGLKTKWLDVTGEAPISYCEPIRPFWAKISMHTEPGRDLAWRTTTGAGYGGVVKDNAGWSRAAYQRGDAGAAPEQRSDSHPTEHAHRGGDSQSEEPSQTKKRPPSELAEVERSERIFGLNPPDVGRELVELIEQDEEPGEFFGDLGRRQNLRLAVLDWLSRQDSVRLTPDEAMEAIESVEEPQAVIESILSREWENWGDPLWWQRQQEIEEVAAREHVRRAGDERQDDVEKEVTIRQKDEFFIRDDSLGGNLSSQFWNYHGLEKRKVGIDYWTLPVRERENDPVKNGGGSGAKTGGSAKPPVKKAPPERAPVKNAPANRTPVKKGAAKKRVPR